MELLKPNINLKNFCGQKISFVVNKQLSRSNIGAFLSSVTPFRNFASKSIYSPEVDLDIKFLEMGDYQWIKIEG